MGWSGQKCEHQTGRPGVPVARGEKERAVRCFRQRPEDRDWKVAFAAKMSLTGDPGEGYSSVAGRHTGERILRNAGDRRAAGKRSGSGLEVGSGLGRVCECLEQSLWGWRDSHHLRRWEKWWRALGRLGVYSPPPRYLFIFVFWWENTGHPVFRREEQKELKKSVWR